MPREVEGQVFYSSKEAAKRLGVHPRTLTRWVKKGGENGFPPIEHNVDRSGRLFFREDIVENLIREFLTDQK